MDPSSHPDRGAGTPAAGGEAAGREPDIINAAELCARLQIKDKTTVAQLAADGILPGLKVGDDWLFSWLAVYAWIAGPGVPPGEILTARQLSHRLGIGEHLVRRTAGPPGTPGKLPGRRVGNPWRFAVEAVLAAIRDPVRAPGAPAGAAEDETASPVPR